MKTEVSVVVETRGKHTKLKLPPKIFTTAAEQLRFDALKTGNLVIEEWSKVKASVSLVCLGKEKPTKEFAFVITLTGASKDIRVLYKPAELQRLRLYIDARSPDALSGGSLELYWHGYGALAVPLAPMKLPIPPESASVRTRQEKTLDVKRSRLLVRDKARKQLVELYHRSLAEKTELGGCIFGWMASFDVTVIEGIKLPPDGVALPDQFSYNPHFWLEAHKACERAGSYVMGWVHTHLCEERGHPHTLSLQDLKTCHQFFNSPWLVAGLVCASRKNPDVKWFSWWSGGISEQTDGIEYVSSPH